MFNFILLGFQQTENSMDLIGRKMSGFGIESVQWNNVCNIPVWIIFFFLINLHHQSVTKLHRKQRPILEPIFLPALLFSFDVQNVHNDAYPYLFQSSLPTASIYQLYYFLLMCKMHPMMLIHILSRVPCQLQV